MIPKKWLIEVGSLLSRALNVLVFFGEANMNLSARAYIRRKEGSRFWSLSERFINALIFWDEDHCEKVWLNRKRRARETEDRHYRAHS